MFPTVNTSQGYNIILKLEKDVGGSPGGGGWWWWFLWFILQFLHFENVLVTVLHLTFRREFNWAKENEYIYITSLELTAP